VEFVSILDQDLPDALINGQIAVCHLHEPFITEGVRKGLKVLSTGADIPRTITNVLAFRSNIVEQISDDVLSLVR
jgi:hypothetical protein